MVKVRFIALADLRRQHENDCRRRLGQLERQRLDLVERRSQLIQEREAAAGAVINPGLHEIYACFWIRIEADLTQIQQTLVGVETAIAKVRGELAEAHRAVKVIEKLQERDRLRFAREADSRDRRRLDEFAGFRHLIAATAGEVGS